MNNRNKRNMNDEVDVEAAGGCAGADDDAQRDADAEARKDGAEEDVLRQHPAIRHPLEQAVQVPRSLDHL